MKDIPRSKIEYILSEMKSSLGEPSGFYSAWIGGEDVSDWQDNHFEDNISTGEGFGERSATESFIFKLEALLNE